MNQPFYPFYPHDPILYQAQEEKRKLKKDATYIGVLSIVLTMVMQFTFTVFVIAFLRLGLIVPEQLSDPFLGLGNTAYMFFYSGIYVFALLIPAVVVSLCFKRRFWPLAPAKPVPFSFAFFGIIGAMGTCMLANIINSYILTFFSEIGLSVPEVPETMVPTPISLVLNLFAIAVLPALLEEMIYRGYILRTLRPYGNMFAVLISSMLFSLMHGNLRQIPFAFIVGLVLGFLYVVSDNIWLSVAVHFTNNAISVVMEYCGFFLPEERVGIYYALVIYCLTFVGIISAIILFVMHKKRLEVPKTRIVLSTSNRTSALFSTPLFLISILLYAVLLFMEI